MERGLKAPNLEAVVAIAQALRVSVAEMVSGFHSDRFLKSSSPLTGYRGGRGETISTPS